MWKDCRDLRVENTKIDLKFETLDAETAEKDDKIKRMKDEISAACRTPTAGGAFFP